MLKRISHEVTTVGLIKRQFRIEDTLWARWQRANNRAATNGSELIRRFIEEYTTKKEKELNIMAQVVETIARRDDFPIDGEAYVVGKVDDGRYFFAWGPEYPFADEVPAHDIEDGESGLSYHETEEEARKAMEEAVKAAEIARPELKRDRIKQIFLEIAGTDSDWSYAADKFVQWCISKDFQVESFDNFVEWLDDDRIDSVWDFWFGYGDDFEKFADDWVSDEEREEYLEYCREHS
jgi:hypothetical protein